MQSKLQAIVAALWQIAEKTGKAGKHLDSELAVACYVKGTSRQLRVGRRNTYPAARGAATSAAWPSVSLIPPASRLMSHPTLGTFGNSTWEQTHSLADTRRSIMTDYPTRTTPDLTSQADGSTGSTRSPKSELAEVLDALSADAANWRRLLAELTARGFAEMSLSDILVCFPDF